MNTVKLVTIIMILSLSVSAQQIALSGTVKRADAVPIESLTVVLENNGMPQAETMTDELGNYALTVNAGQYTALRVRNQDKKIQGVPATIEHTAHSNLNLTNDTIVNITMPAYIHIQGKLHDGDSTALANAQMQIKKWEGSEMTPWDRDITTGDGSYSLYMRPGGVKFWITPQGAEQITFVDTISSDTTFNIYLPKLVTLSGTVTTPAGDSLHRITVAIEKPMEQYEATTNEQGFYSKVMNPGMYRIRLRNGMNGTAQGVPSTLEETKIDTFHLASDTTLNLSTLFYPSLRCSVVNTAGTPIPNVGITAKRWQGSEMTPWDHDTTNAAGICRLYVFNSNNKLWIYPPQDSDYVELSFEIAVTKDTTITIVLSKGAQLTGKVFRADSTPVAGISVALEKDMNQWMEQTDASGSYLFKMQQGTYRLRVRNMNTEIAGIPKTIEHTVLDTLQLTQPETLNIYLPFYPTISGVVRDPAGTAVVGAQLVAKRWDGAELPPWDDKISNPSGNYSLTVGGGTNKIWVTPPSGSNLGTFSFIESFTENITKDIFIPDQAKGITRFLPSVITRGNSGEVMVNGINVNFTSGSVSIDLGEKITVSNIRVISNITLLADVAIDSLASTGVRDVKVTVGAEKLIGPNLLTITAQAKDTALLDGNNRTTREILISDGAGTELRVPKGTEVVFPDSVAKTIGYESPILQGDDPVISGGGLLEVQKKLSPSGLVFKDTVYMTVQYKDQDVKGINEMTLVPFFYFDSDTGTGRLGDSMIVVSRDTAANTITFSIPHFSLFRMVSKTGNIAIRVDDNRHRVATHLSLRTLAHQYAQLSFVLNAQDAKEHISLHIFDIKGRVIKTLVSGVLGAGKHSVQWDGTGNAQRQLGSGFYVFVLTIGKKRTLYTHMVLTH